MARERRGILAACAVLAAVAACGGRATSGTSQPSSAGTAAVGATGSNVGGNAATAGAESSGAVSSATAGNAAVGMAGSAAPGAGGASPNACTPGAPPSCADGAIATCSADGMLQRQECKDHESCVDGACALADQPLGLESNEFGFAWRDAYMLLPCYEVSGHDCLTVPDGVCPQDGTFEEKGMTLRETFAIGGELGKLYKAHLVVNGVVSGKYYAGGVRDQGNDFSDAGEPEGLDGFHSGGMPIESSYDTWQITIRDAQGEVFNHHYLNSFPQNSGFESHQTVLLGYEKDIEVPGGGTVEYRVHDPNCRAIDNCGLDPLPQCVGARVIPNETDRTLPDTWQGQPLASYNVVNGGAQPFHSQIVHLRVTKVVYAGKLEP